MFIERTTAKRFVLAPAERRVSLWRSAELLCGSKQMPRPRLEANVPDTFENWMLASACYRKRFCRVLHFPGFQLHAGGASSGARATPEPPADSAKLRCRAK